MAEWIGHKDKFDRTYWLCDGGCRTRRVQENKPGTCAVCAARSEMPSVCPVLKELIVARNACKATDTPDQAWVRWSDGKLVVQTTIVPGVAVVGIGRDMNNADVWELATLCKFLFHGDVPRDAL